MEIRELRYFIAVAREGNISKAAETLYITQPTLSRQMSILEDKLGVLLFERGSRKIVLTDKGRLLYQYALEIIELHDKAEREMMETEHIAGEIVIACVVAASVDEMTLALHDFNKKYPDVKIHLITGTRSQIIEKMNTGAVDIGLIIRYLEDERFHSIKLNTKDCFGLFMKKTSPLATKSFITSADLKNIPLSIPGSNPNHMINQWLDNNTTALNIYGTHDLLNNVAGLVKNDICYAITLEAAAKQYNDPELCFRPLEPQLLCESYIVWNKNHHFSLTVSTFIKFLSEYFHVDF